MDELPHFWRQARGDGSYLNLDYRNTKNDKLNMSTLTMTIHFAANKILNPQHRIRSYSPKGQIAFASPDDKWTEKQEEALQKTEEYMHNEIICPHCKKAFKVDDTAFAGILKQVRDSEFNTELHARIEDAVRLAVSEAKNEARVDASKKDAEIAKLAAEKESAVQLATATTKNELQADVAKRNAEIASLQSKLKEKEDEVRLVEAQTKNSLQEVLSKRSEEIAILQHKLETKESEKNTAITEAIHGVEKERNELIAKLRDRDNEVLLIESRTKNTLQEDIAKKETEIVRLQSDLNSKETEKRLAISEAINSIEKERDELAGKLESKDSQTKLLEVNLRDKYETELRLKDDQIAQYKDFKAKQSVKLLGESLEQHCEIAFRQWQATGAFRNVSFGKDNDTTATGTKGDYIYRETDELGNEILSIMFEMKNEADDSTTKKKNEDYFKKLDQDRIKSGCEYAVLITVLDADSELYTGITDVSYVHDKMYVVRPQFFMPMITILRNAALNSLRYKAELALVREQNIDITNFENELQLFQSDFMKNVKNSGSKFKEAMDGIDKTIKQLENIKEALRLSNKHLLTAGNKVEDVSVKRLTKNNPTMAAKFAGLKVDDE